MADIKLQGHLVKISESWLTNCKRKNPRYGLQIGDDNIKPVQKLKYLGSLVTEDGKSDTEIETCIEQCIPKAKYWEAKKRVLD